MTRSTELITGEDLDEGPEVATKGRRRSRVTLLKVYMVASSVGVLLSIACVANGNVTLEVFQTPNRWETHKFELLEAARTAIGEIYTSLSTMLIELMLDEV
ncbi:uncharacterized protein LOC112196458 isoform X3 [Rosa chinensis]|uniref:uncharacterized protein LOC112196458 isoform X3 n=1 Tax=Rosa chinensis TaxID=74649 RepID=UPI001AD8C0E5|nr:uncharacterized protein LOC112196458 isoform X3 [Rosa chinensis]